ncbi:MAG: hypothetical protein RhofKO_19670 [Rhodothermales bacterium]
MRHPENIAPIFSTIFLPLWLHAVEHVNNTQGMAVISRLNYHRERLAEARQKLQLNQPHYLVRRALVQTLSTIAHSSVSGASDALRGDLAIGCFYGHCELDSFGSKWSSHEINSDDPLEDDHSLALDKCETCITVTPGAVQAANPEYMLLLADAQAILESTKMQFYERADQTFTYWHEHVQSLFERHEAQVMRIAADVEVEEFWLRIYTSIEEDIERVGEAVAYWERQEGVELSFDEQKYAFIYNVVRNTLLRTQFILAISQQWSLSEIKACAVYNAWTLSPITPSAHSAKRRRLLEENGAVQAMPKDEFIVFEEELNKAVEELSKMGWPKA